MYVKQKNCKVRQKHFGWCTTVSDKPLLSLSFYLSNNSNF